MALLPLQETECNDDDDNDSDDDNDYCCFIIIIIITIIIFVIIILFIIIIITIFLENFKMHGTKDSDSRYYFCAKGTDVT